MLLQLWVRSTFGKSVKAPTGKGMGLGKLPSELHNFAAEQMVRLWDPIVVEITLALDVPIQFKGGDYARIRKSHWKPAHELTNMREVL